MMRLNRLLPLLQKHPALAGLSRDIESMAARQGPGSGARTIPTFSAITPARPFALAALYASLNRTTLLIVPRPGDARRYAEELRAWVPVPEAVLLFPETDALPYDYLPSDPDKLADRLQALQVLCGTRPLAPETRAPLVVASVRAALDVVTPSDTFLARHRSIHGGERLSPTRVAEEWLALGYEPSPLVDQPGLFGRRGGILDVYPPGGVPVRLEFWGDEVETIRSFDPATQRSTGQLDAVLIGPAHEVLPGPLPHPLDLSSVRAQFRGPYERDQRQLDLSQAFPTLEFYRGFLGGATLLDYLPDGALLALDEPGALASGASEFEQQVEELHADLLDRGETPPGVARPYRPWSDVLRGVDPKPLARVQLRFDPDAESLPFVHAAKFGGRLDSVLSHLLQEDGPRQVVVSQQDSRLRELLADQGARVPSLAEASTDEQRLTLVHGTLREGWRSAGLDLELLTDSEIFGFTKQRRAQGTGRRTERVGASREQFLADLKDGELVVHTDHGIGRFRGLIRSAIGFQPEQPVSARQAPPGSAEFVLLEYAAGDRLYVPVSQADRVARYVGSGDQDPRLTRLGSGEWTRAKAKVRRSVRDMALELMDLYAAREAAPGHQYPADTPWQQELEASFPYEETRDQISAIQAVKDDMQSPRPMDRLLVGDVGFGKTEVALRAAFKAVQDGRQAAVLVPTTVLAQQHFNTFQDRLAPFPVKVEMLSRFRSAREQATVLKGLADGSVDICIGTHRLVQRDVVFKNLGLVIIDEEQRFGVAHKERLKQLRKEVDVLTLTATPIPRTLHMGLVGVRDMSVLETAPEARLPVRTYVLEYDESQVREAILREIDRGGQVYFVHNRVQGIETIAGRLRRLVPEARIRVAHGQMPEDQLERAMLDFTEGEYDVLVCTTIIESGLDIASANTLIVNNAHRFGLAQLYQLRGRVGRAAQRAYAYFLYTRDLQLTEVAAERLKTIFEATELGAGMRIAMKDLEIRGAGNLLGASQSGHISAVGFDLYTTLLAEQVELLRSRRAGGRDGQHAPGAADAPATSFDLPLSAFIPPELVPDDATRLRLYQRFSGVATDADLANLVAEVEDRFGKLPEAAQNLVYLASLRLRAAEAGVEQVAAVDGEIVVRLDRLPVLDLSKLSAAVGAPLRHGSNQLRLPRGTDESWMGRLYTLVEALPGRR